MQVASSMISGYSLYLNFDSNIDSLSTLGIHGVGSFDSKKIPAVQVHFDTPNFIDHV